MIGTIYVNLIIREIHLVQGMREGSSVCTVYMPSIWKMGIVFRHRRNESVYSNQVIIFLFGKFDSTSIDFHLLLFAMVQYRIYTIHDRIGLK